LCRRSNLTALKKIYIIRKIKKGQEKVSGLKSAFGVIKFDKNKCKLGIPQTLKNANCWSTKYSETNLNDYLTINSFTVFSSYDTTAPVIA
jgi:hypothetical protein